MMAVRRSRVTNSLTAMTKKPQKKDPQPKKSKKQTKRKGDWLLLVLNEI